MRYIVLADNLTAHLEAAQAVHSYVAFNAQGTAAFLLVIPVGADIRREWTALNRINGVKQ